MLELPRGGKIRAQDAAVRAARGDVIAFGDANALWAPDALRALMRPFADAQVGYVCGQVTFTNEAGTNQEGLYWRYEMFLRAQESALASVTGGNGAIYAVRREAYVEVDPIMGHDLSFPFRMVKNGWRAVYQPAARATEKMVPSIEGEWARKRRMMSHGWPIVIKGGLADPRGYSPLYALMIVSHRLLRYGTPFLHVLTALATLALLRRGGVYQAAAAAQAALVAAAFAPGARPSPRSSPATTCSRPPRSPPACTTGCATARPPGGTRRRAPRSDRRARTCSSRRKRALDLVLAGGALLVAAPVIAVAAAAVRLESHGHPIYRQHRVGKDGHGFEVIKLRTMVSGAEQLGAGMAVDEGDARITRVGAFLRRTSIDELPNLVNVLRGEMSLIGPRPTLQVQVDAYTDRQRQRLAVRPGLSGWAQVNGRASLPWPERIELDIWYLEHASLRLDLRILYLSARMAITGHGLYRGETGGWRPEPRLSGMPALRDDFRALVDVGLAEGPQRVEDLVVHGRAAELADPTPSRPPRTASSSGSRRAACGSPPRSPS